MPRKAAKGAGSRSEGLKSKKRPNTTDQRDAKGRATKKNASPRGTSTKRPKKVSVDAMAERQLLETAAPDAQLSAVEDAVDATLLAGGQDPALNRVMSDYGYDSNSIQGFMSGVRGRLEPDYELTFDRKLGNRILPLKKGAASAVLNEKTKAGKP